MNPYQKLAEAGGDEPVVRVKVLCRCSGTGWWKYDVVPGSTTTCAETDQGAIRCECDGVQYRTLRVACDGSDDSLYGWDCENGKIWGTDRDCPTCQGRGWTCLEGGDAAWVTYLWYQRTLSEKFGLLYLKDGSARPTVFYDAAALIEAAEQLIERKENKMTEVRLACQCEECRIGILHKSDCAVHNGPALPKGKCSCEATESLMRQPAEVFPPSEFIQEEMEARDWSKQDLAQRAVLSVQEVEYLLSGGRISAQIAERLSRAFGTSPQYWSHLWMAWKKFGRH